jgi:hypothetical protein
MTSHIIIVEIEENKLNIFLLLILLLAFVMVCILFGNCPCHAIIILTIVDIYIHTLKKICVKYII